MVLFLIALLLIQGTPGNSGARRSVYEKMYRAAMEARRSGDTGHALRTYQEILKLQEQSDDRASQMRTLENIGDTYHYGRTDWQESSGYYERALRIARELGERAHEAATLNQLGLVELSLGNRDKAEKLLKEALDVADETKEKEVLGSVLNSIGYLHLVSDDPDNAHAFFVKSLRIRQELKTLGPIGTTQYNLGRAERARKNYDHALGYLRDAIGSRVKDRDPMGEISARVEIAEILAEQKNLAGALSEYRRIAAIAEHRHHYRGRLIAYAGLGSTAFSAGQYQQSADYFESLRSLAAQAGDLVMERQALENVAIARMALKQYPAAAADLEAALALTQSGANPGVAENIRISLAIAYCELENYDQAVRSYVELAGNPAAAALPNFKLLGERITRIRGKIGEQEFQKLEGLARAEIRKKVDR